MTLQDRLTEHREKAEAAQEHYADWTTGAYAMVAYRGEYVLPNFIAANDPTTVLALIAVASEYERLVVAVFRGLAALDESDQIPMYDAVMPVLGAGRATLDHLEKVMSDE